MEQETKATRDQEMRDAFKFTNATAGEDAIDKNATITSEELALLDAAGEDDEERMLHDAELDNKDEDGDLLNEASSANAISGSDLDVPGAEDDNENEAIGEEDEENNSYSLGADKKD